MHHVSEQFANRLIRVIKKVKRRSKDGSTKTIKQSFHVKKANPGDVYAVGTKRDRGMAKTDLRPSSQVVDLGAPVTEPAEEPEPPVEEVAPATRLTVRYHDVPWVLGDGDRDQKDRDPVSATLRNRFSDKNRAEQTTQPLAFDAPLNRTHPTDPVMWGIDEPNLLDHMQTGRIARMGLIGYDNGLLSAKIDGQNGTSVRAYMGLDSLVDPMVYKLWGDFYGLEKGSGDIAKRQTCAYEIAKVTGFDDLVPPTVVRYDRFGDIEAVLPQDLIERRIEHFEHLAMKTGEHPTDLRRQLSGFAWVQFKKGETWTVEKEDWFVDVFQRQGELDRKDVLNHIFDAMPPLVRMAFLRASLFDFILWTGDRHFGDIVFCEHEGHPIHLVGNEICLPDPKKIGAMAMNGPLNYLDVQDNPQGGVPMLWSEMLTHVASRASDRELEDIDKIGTYVHHRMKGDRAFELARALYEHHIPAISIAGVLSRVWLLATHSKDVARNPYFVADYYAALMNGSPPKEMAGVAAYVNKAMTNTLVGDYDFYQEMQTPDGEGSEEGNEKRQKDKDDRERDKREVTDVGKE